MKEFWRYLIAILFCVLMVALLYTLIDLSIRDEKFVAGDVHLIGEQIDDRPPVKFVKTKVVKKERWITSEGEIVYIVLFKVPERTDEQPWAIDKDQWVLLDTDNRILVVYRVWETQGNIELLNFDLLK